MDITTEIMSDFQNFYNSENFQVFAIRRKWTCHLSHAEILHAKRAVLWNSQKIDFLLQSVENITFRLVKRPLCVKLLLNCSVENPEKSIILKILKFSASYR